MILDNLRDVHFEREFAELSRGGDALDADYLEELANEIRWNMLPADDYDLDDALRLFVIELEDRARGLRESSAEYAR